MAISFITVAYLKNDHTGVSEIGLPLFRYCTVEDADLQMTWGPEIRGGGGGGRSRKKIFLLSTLILDHIIRASSHT